MRLNLLFSRRWLTAPVVVRVFWPGDARWWIWSPALTIMAVACLINLARCRRLHCYLTGPVFLVGAVLSMMRGLDLVHVSWNWISGVMLIAAAAGCGLECVFGSYLRNRREA